MARNRILSAALAFLSVAAAALPVAAQEKGRYDGTWVVDIPAAIEQKTTNPTCPALRLVIQVKDDRVSARLERNPTANTVANSDASDAPVLTGHVTPDGTVNADWQGFTATGKLKGDTADLVVKGECGPRNATGVRVSR